MLVAISVLVLLMTAVGASLTIAMSRQAAAKSSRDADHATALAEGGADEALFELQLGRDLAGGGIGNAQGNLSDGAFVATVTPPFGAPDQYTIHSAATVHGVSRAVQVVCNRRQGVAGFIANAGITLSGTAMLDSFDSTLGTYASQVSGTHAGSSMPLRSNTGITVSGGYNVWGDANPGPGYTISGSTTGIHGSSTPASTTVTMPSYAYSPPIPASGSLAGSATLSSGTYRYTQVSISGGQALTFNGNVTLYCDGKFTISGSGYGKLNPGAKVTIYTGSGDVTMSGGGVINSDQNPANLSLVTASTTKVTVSGSAGWFGTVLAPYAQLVTSGSGGYYGAATVKSINDSGGAALHYDVALGRGAGQGFQVVSVIPVRP